jgi:nitrite reductase/ring-hydroxylating ferredoxin subunit
VSGWARLAAPDAVPEGTSVLIEHGGQKVLLTRLDGALRAYDGRCPHARTALAAGPLSEGRYIECPMHGARFAAADGALQPGPVTCPGLSAWPVRVQDGHVEVDVPERPPTDWGGGRPQNWVTARPRTPARSETTT